MPKVITELKTSEEKLKSELIEKQELQEDLSKKEVEIQTQDQDIIELGNQIQNLLNELRIVAKALEVYEGESIKSLETANLGNRINKALAARINQLNVLNNQLEELNIALIKKDKDLLSKIQEINKVNKALAKSDEDLEQKVLELSKANEQLTISH